MKYWTTALIAAIVVANGVSPYFGLKWEHSMAMFSGLRVDVANHFLFSGLPRVGAERYYTVTQFSCERAEEREAVALFRRLLAVTNQPSDVNASRCNGEPNDDSTLAINENLLKYHIYRMKRAGVVANLCLRESESGAQACIYVPEASAEWTAYSVVTLYPLLDGDAGYDTIHGLLKEYNSRCMEAP